VRHQTKRREKVVIDVSDSGTNEERGINSVGRGQGAKPIEEVVHQLNGICRTTGLEFALRVGAVIIHNFYDGDTRAWRDRGPKLHSFRRLAKHPDLLISPGALYRCVAVFELCERLHAPTRWRRLGASHLRAVLCIPVQKQASLLESANRERWSVQTLQAKARELRESRSRGGRRARSPLEKTLRALDQRVRDCEDAFEQVEFQESGELHRSLEQIVKIGAAVEQLKRSIEIWRDRLEVELVEVPGHEMAPGASWDVEHGTGGDVRRECSSGSGARDAPSQGEYRLPTCQ
jgi:hypothetical protein